ncbi:MAG TPA: OsmC family protein [Rhodothermales bacterium]|nr:OsmC family protein [Bacteroidetes Order II. bacterium]HRK75233.1 OsmC family protein [Rhodothermales bacterium]HRR07493.1 OsmC family protein [Rhodothermales bacterium]
MMDVHHLYEVDVSWTHDRKGLLTSPVLSELIEVATPPEFTKGEVGIWSPEHLFVAALSSCLMTTFLAIAENSRLDFTSFGCNAVGKLEKDGLGGFAITQVVLRPEIELTSEAQVEKAQRILEKAEKACLISRSVKSEIVLSPKIRVTKNVPS